MLLNNSNVTELPRAKNPNKVKLMLYISEVENEKYEACKNGYIMLATVAIGFFFFLICEICI